MSILYFTQGRPPTVYINSETCGCNPGVCRGVMIFTFRLMKGQLCLLVLLCFLLSSVIHVNFYSEIHPSLVS